MNGYFDDKGLDGVKLVHTKHPSSYTGLVIISGFNLAVNAFVLGILIRLFLW